jgi:hypothetical protein
MSSTSGRSSSSAGRRLRAHSQVARRPLCCPGGTTPGKPPRAWGDCPSPHTPWPPGPTGQHGGAERDRERAPRPLPRSGRPVAEYSMFAHRASSSGATSSGARRCSTPCPSATTRTRDAITSPAEGPAALRSGLRRFTVIMAGSLMAACVWKWNEMWLLDIVSAQMSCCPPACQAKSRILWHLSLLFNLWRPG